MTAARWEAQRDADAERVLRGDVHPYDTKVDRALLLVADAAEKRVRAQFGHVTQEQRDREIDRAQLAVMREALADPAVLGRIAARAWLARERGHRHELRWGDAMRAGEERGRVRRVRVAVATYSTEEIKEALAHVPDRWTFVRDPVAGRRPRRWDGPPGTGHVRVWDADGDCLPAALATALGVVHPFAAHRSPHTAASDVDDARRVLRVATEVAS